MRKKLIDLIIEAKRTDPETGQFTEYLTDYLIKNGIVIPVRCWECRKRKTEECGMNLKTAYYYHSWEDDEDYCSYGEPNESEE